MDGNIEVNPVQQTPEPAPRPKAHALKIATGVLLVLLIGFGVVYALGGGKFFSSRDNGKDQKEIIPPPTENEDEPGDTDTGYPEPLVSGIVRWNYPENLYQLGLVDEPSFGYGSKDNEDEDLGTYYKVGVFLSGKYKDGELIIFSAPSGGIGGEQNYRIVRMSNKYFFLSKYSDELYEDDYVNESKLIKDPTFTLSDLEFPKTITNPQNSRQTLSASGSPFFMLGSIVFFNSTGLKFVYNDPKVGAVFTTPDEPDQVDQIFRAEGFYVKAPDSSTIFYTLKPDFVDQFNIPAVTWNNKSKNVEEYNYTDVGGCGSRNLASISRTIKMEELVQTGINSKGDKIYELKDTNHSLLKQVYENDYGVGFGYDQQKIPFSEFVKRHPVFFWIDPFGRLIKFQNNKFLPAAECGKPVIYLYPEKPTKVEVKISPVGGFTYTEPQYDNGWSVVAQPDGLLTELKSGKQYPYLFWEGRGGLYKIPDKGFMVKREEVHNFLQDKLLQLGLNQNESQEFMEYWEPYMQEKPYYFITFMGNKEADQIAPLEVSPKPDTVIRILMDFKPLDEPIEVQGYLIRTPERKGFTVVEWGGVKH